MVQSIPSTPVGYADDLASASTTKQKTDRALQLVHNFGRKWRFEFNARKSAILVYGEGRKDHERASKDRVFKLGKDRILEKREYDHVGIKACIFSDDNGRIKEKISKGRRTLNATTGVGIRKNGLCMWICNLIFWTIVVPTVTFGCELWSVSDKDVEEIQAFQRYAGRRLQRFPLRSPSCSSYFGMGWIRLDTFAQIKKLLFLLTFMRLKEDNRLIQVFNARVHQYVRDGSKGLENKYFSPVFDMLNVSARFGLLNKGLDMVVGRCALMGKKAGQKLCGTEHGRSMRGTGGAR